jgi:hypothetical protein
MKNSTTVLIVALGWVTACNWRPAEVTNVPYGYKGWVEIRYSSSCPPAPQSAGGQRILNIGAEGKLCVGSPWREGYARDTFFYVAGGRRYELHEDTPHTGMVWGRYTRVENLGVERLDGFFVGTEAEYRKATLSHETPRR